MSNETVLVKSAIYHPHVVVSVSQYLYFMLLVLGNTKTDDVQFMTHSFCGCFHLSLMSYSSTEFVACVYSIRV